MTYKSSFELHHNFPKLAEESGFSFNVHRSRIPIEWNKIRLIDIENIIKERKFIIVEQHISDILNCVLESEFDVRILDEGVLKIFRLSQLAVEYQQFCRNYLDRSVYVLREEVTNILKELEVSKRSLKEKEEEIKKLKRKSKYSLRTNVPYGNENIAAMLLKTLNNNKGDIFSATSLTDVQHYNKCSYCEKVFLNQLYLKSHISRRHPNCLEIPQKDNVESDCVNDIATTKLNEEVEELKLKLKQMEELIRNSHNYDQPRTNDPDKSQENFVSNTIQHKQNNSDTRVMKDAEVLTEDDGTNDKIDQWKKEEYERYNQEIILLRQQIIDIVNSKEKQDQSSVKNDLNMMEQLQETIKQQNCELLELKEQLLKCENNERERRKDIETQMMHWVKQVEEQSNEYKALLHKLNDVANEAREYRAQAEAEKKKSLKLQEILQNHVTETPKKDNISSVSNKNNVPDKAEEKKNSNNTPMPKVSGHIPATEDLISLSNLQQKAQELLNMNETSTGESSSASDRSRNSENKPKNYIISSSSKLRDESQKQKQKLSNLCDAIDFDKRKVTDIKNKHNSNLGKNKSKKENGYVHIPSSPMKLVRAKITEEVNKRLIFLGVDPLKNRLPENYFQKQRMLLQKEQEIKAKKFPMREKILHSIMSNIDQNTPNKTPIQKNDYVSPNKSPKAFSFSSVLTNVKTKALSLVKSSETSNKPNKSYNDVAKKAMALLQTPPGSALSSPTVRRQKVVISPNKTVKKVKHSKKKIKRQPSQLIEQSEPINVINASNDDSSESSLHELSQEQISKVVKNLVKSPIRQPSNILENQYQSNHILFVNGDKKVHKTNDSNEANKEKVNISKNSLFDNNQDSSDDIESIESSPRKFLSEDNLNHLKQTKGVLKNASSTSSLNKKKVLFDMDAIQMKSVSASPSQSLTEKSNNNEQYEIQYLHAQEWDISSIENEPVRSAVNVQVTSQTSPKIAELKQSIESQLSRRNRTLSTALIGGIDVLTGSIKKASFGGSNTSLGSSILDETDSSPLQSKKNFTQPKPVEKEDSEIEISDLINETMENKNYIKSY